MEKEMLRVEQLCKHYPVKARTPWEKRKAVHAVDGVSFSVHKGETIGIVGESGCGKSTLGQCILMLQKPTSGSVWYGEKELTRCTERELRPLRSKLQIVFQDPYSSLDPSKTVEKILAEPLEAQAGIGGYSREKIRQRVEEVAELVGLEKNCLQRYPHEFSGGQRQRIGIARAFATEPELIICDEAVSALDVSIQAQVINLLQDLKEKTGVSYLFISHDLGIVRYVSDRILVLYLGKVVESAHADELFNRPSHPYTNTLLDAIPMPDPEKRMNYSRETADFPSPLDLPTGCRFHTRCPYCDGTRCVREEPELVEIAEGHFCACHYAKER